MRRPGSKKDTGDVSLHNVHDVTAALEELSFYLEFCPVCGKVLEQHPNDTYKLSCYTHGDFILRWNTDKTVTAEWSFMNFLPKE